MHIAVTDHKTHVAEIVLLNAILVWDQVIQTATHVPQIQIQRRVIHVLDLKTLVVDLKTPVVDLKTPVVYLKTLVVDLKTPVAVEVIHVVQIMMNVA